MLTGAVKNGLVFKGGFVCSKAWCTIYGIAQTRYFSFELFNKLVIFKCNTLRHWLDICFPQYRYIGAK